MFSIISTCIVLLSCVLHSDKCGITSPKDKEGRFFFSKQKALKPYPYIFLFKSDHVPFHHIASMATDRIVGETRLE